MRVYSLGFYGLRFSGFEGRVGGPCGSLESPRLRALCFGFTVSGLGFRVCAFVHRFWANRRLRCGVFGLR